MTDGDTIREGQILTGPLFSEPMRVETVAANGPAAWTLGLVGTQTERFRRVALTKDQLATLTVTSPAPSYAGAGGSVRLGLQAYALGIAWEFDPYFGLSVSRVDPLPHQLEAVYDYLLKVARVRFLLADDAGAGKTIMAGLLIRELKLRGLAERILIVTPANLAFQWQRELKEKFDEKFLVLRGADLRVQFGVNPWLEHAQILTSLDLAKREEILPSIMQSHWDLVVVDEAHRMSAAAEDKKSLRYKLGELLRDITDHYLLLTATPHRGDPENFSLFLRLLDQDAFADVRSIRQAMDQRRAPFYLRRTKEAMVYFPERQADGTWTARKIFTKRIPHSVEFAIDGEEFRLYRDVTAFVKAQSSQAAVQGEDARARAVGFLMALYQRRLASSVYAVRRSLENRARRLREGLQRATDLARQAPPDLPTPDELEEMEDHERERLEAILEAITLTQHPRHVEEEIADLTRLGEQALAVERAGAEAKLGRLQRLLREKGFFDDPDQRLLIFTEFKDTLDYLVQALTSWGFRVGVIHGGMKPGSREEPNTRLHAEQQFKDGAIQVLVATEAAGEGINLQVCHVLVNFDIPWNPNRLEQRMGRIHRYGQTQDCLIFNFVATNTIEGRVLRKLLEKLQEIRDALDDDAVFNVVGEVLPAAHLERVLRDYYAGRLGDQDLEERLLRNVNEASFRSICQNALEGLAAKALNLAMLIERRAKAQERRLVPETIARFLGASASQVPMTLREVKALPHTFDPGPTPATLRRYEQDADWRLPVLAGRYPRLSTSRETAETQRLEWVTPGHPLFEALRRHALDQSRPHFAQGACFHALDAAEPTRLDVYRARIVDGLGHVIHERLFVVGLTGGQEPALHEVGAFGNLQPAPVPALLPPITAEPEPLAWLHAEALQPFLAEVQAERGAELDRIAAHIELSLTELIEREDRLVGRLMEDRDRGVEGAAGNLAQAEERQSALLRRRERRREELQRQGALSLQAVERITTALVLPHPEAGRPEVRRLRPDPETEATAMRVATEYERAQGRAVADVHEQNLGYDLTSLDTRSGELRLIEVKGIGEAAGSVLLTPNERRVAEDRRDCYWLYVVTDCRTTPRLQEPVKDPARLPWHEVRKIDHYWLAVDALTQPMQVREEGGTYGNMSP
jgi:superfamily II DNA or RNA helicase